MGYFVVLLSIKMRRNFLLLLLLLLVLFNFFRILKKVEETWRILAYRDSTLYVVLQDIERIHDEYRFDGSFCGKRIKILTTSPFLFPDLAFCFFCTSFTHKFLPGFQSISVPVADSNDGESISRISGSIMYSFLSSVLVK